MGTAGASPHAVASTADRNLHMHAIQYYQQAKDCLARRAVHPQLWDRIQLELGGTHLGVAALLASAAPGLRDDTHVDSYLNSAIAIFADISRNLTSASATAGRHDNAAWISAMRRAVSLKLGEAHHRLGLVHRRWAAAAARTAASKASKVAESHLNKALSYYAMYPDETAGLVLQVHFERATLHSSAHGRHSGSPSVGALKRSLRDLLACKDALATLLRARRACATDAHSSVSTQVADGAPSLPLAVQVRKTSAGPSSLAELRNPERHRKTARSS
ncbi:hypothetical protein PTSG_00633 [Salpingoeca rosetta]|uniref:EDRF1 TPR repeats region domain-containing protein n=1 Tax=Salpingoeca rosetta (strain ATCC 50818 / BSB-021) TaxID=946362 RepID=F2TX16_SALR5|nr:uncharacterized protein PTSG_00633 [Salpingoeca rosetta]EGD75925.1 hypothetical protein PTSG_00633 [Salpingoeca rosetta]|eukprot:XP_004998101.1 hypothetical protein PTSG_00633 [Salpingoeca rosetta]